VSRVNSSARNMTAGMMPKGKDRELAQSMSPVRDVTNKRPRYGAPRKTALVRGDTPGAFTPRVTSLPFGTGGVNKRATRPRSPMEP